MISLTEEQSYVQREKMGRAFAKWLWDNASSDFVESMVKKLENLKERAENRLPPRPHQYVNLQ